MEHILLKCFEYVSFFFKKKWMHVFKIIQYQFTLILNHSKHKYLFLSEINIMHKYSQLKSKYTGKIVGKACGSKSR